MSRIFIIVIGIFLSFSPVYADDWGCQVLLCLSDPRGATTEKECIAPLEKLWRHLAQGGNMPTCDLVNDNPNDFSSEQTPDFK